MIPTLACPARALALLCLSLACVPLWASPAAGQLAAPRLEEPPQAEAPQVEAPDEETPDQALSPFEREFAGAVYATGHAGSYFAGGIGARLRWEPWEWLGVEAYLEATIVDWPGSGFRHDYPNGFNVYVPIRVGDFRVRPFLGFCDILSFVEPDQEGAPRADDVMFGLHGGVGAEYAVASNFSLFADLQANVYMGHDRASDGWTGGLDEELGVFWNVQLNLGVQAHIGRR